MTTIGAKCDPRLAAVVAAVCVAAVLGALHVLAQVAVNTQASNRANQTVSPPMPGSVRYSTSSMAARTSEPMDSEVRHAYWKSGSLPSDFKAGYAAIGPMAEGGAIRYVNYKPSYMAPKKPLPPPAPSSAPYGTMGSVRYASSGPTSPNMVQSRPVDARVPSYAPPKSTPSVSKPVYTTMKSPTSPSISKPAYTTMKSPSSGTVRYHR